jgi:AraC-like DNA-binding protein
MALRVFRPCAPLAAYIDAFWDYEDLTGGETASLSILPDTATYLCFLYKDPLVTAHKAATYRTRSGLAGFQSFRSDLGGRGTISGVSARLTPWGLSVFRPGIVKECADRRVDCRDIFPRYAIERIEDELARLASPEDRVAYIERYLLSVFDPGHEDRIVRRAYDHLLASGGNCRIGDVAARLDLSRRTLERRFVEHIGATPKTVSRILRLRRAIMAKRQPGGWAEVAYAAGYYDQSHMIHDFLDLYGLAPEELLPRISLSPTIRFSGLLDLAGLSHFSNTMPGATDRVR